MSKIPCPHCGNQMDSQASRCASCAGRGGPCKHCGSDLAWSPAIGRRRCPNNCSAMDACPDCGARKMKRSLLCGGCRKARCGPTPTKNGYLKVWEPSHPLAMADGFVLQHRKVLHDAGIDIPSGMQVHHVNGDKRDNRLENLAVLTPLEHAAAHKVGAR